LKIEYRILLRDLKNLTTLMKQTYKPGLNRHQIAAHCQKYIK